VSLRGKCDRGTESALKKKKKKLTGDVKTKHLIITVKHGPKKQVIVTVSANGTVWDDTPTLTT